MYCAKNITHTVKQGDTIYRIAKMHDTTVPDILIRNPGVNPYNLQVGNELLVCEADETGNSQGDNMELNQDIRLAWEQLAYWTRMYLLANKDNQEEVNSSAERLRQIPAVMADIFEQYYPADVTTQLQQSLTSFVENTITLINAVKNSERETTDATEVKLEQDVSNLAEILSNMNINYDKNALETELGEFLVLTKREIVSRVSGQYADDIETFDNLEQQAMKIAEYLSSGIMRQYNRNQNESNQS